jgi:hypothetical protein
MVSVTADNHSPFTTHAFAMGTENHTPPPRSSNTMAVNVSLRTVTHRPTVGASQCLSVNVGDAERRDCVTPGVAQTALATKAVSTPSALVRVVRLCLQVAFIEASLVEICLVALVTVAIYKVTIHKL